MGVTVNFGTFAKRRNSTKQPTNELSDVRTVTLKDLTSYDAPVFILTGDDFNYNYAKWGDRYYFITDVKSVHNGLCEVTCILDPLATYKTEILASTQFVSYSSQLGDNWLVDTRIPLKASCTVSSDSALTGILSNIGCYILSCVGVDCVSTYAFTSDAPIAAMLRDLQTWRDQEKQNTQNIASASSTGASTGSADTTQNYSGISETIASIGNAISHTLADLADAITDTVKSISDAAVQTGFIGNAYENAMSCIRSCIWVPFDFALIQAGSGSSPIMLGTYNTNQSAASVASKPSTGSFSLSIPWQHSDWRRKTCEDVYLYLPLVGMVQLSGDSLTSSSSITVDWSVTYTDGCICYKVKAGSQVIGSYSGQCAVNYPIGIAQQASAGEITQTAFQGAVKTVSAGISTAGKLASGNIGGFAAGVVETGLTGIDAAYNSIDAANSAHISCIGGLGGGAGLGLGREAVCFTVSHDTIIAPSDMKQTMGLPTMKPLSLSGLTGYCQCANAHVECAAQANELDAIDYYLNSGFFIE